MDENSNNLKSTSHDARYKDIFITTHDGRLLVLRKFFGGAKQAVLIIPGIKHTIAERWYDDLATRLHDIKTTCYILELRGHGLSEGIFGVQHHKKDLDIVIGLIHKSFKDLFLIAHDISASLMLERENEGHHVRGMILLSPISEYKTKEESFHLSPVRVQTPTAVFCAPQEAVLKKIFGQVQLHPWNERGTIVEHAHALKAVTDATQQLYKHEKPIRFSTKV